MVEKRRRLVQDHDIDCQPGQGSHQIGCQTGRMTEWGRPSLLIATATVSSAEHSRVRRVSTPCTSDTHPTDLGPSS